MKRSEMTVFTMPQKALIVGRKAQAAGPLDCEWVTRETTLLIALARASLPIMTLRLITVSLSCLLLIPWQLYSDTSNARTYQRHAELANLWLFDHLETRSGFAEYWYDPTGVRSLSGHPMGPLIQAHRIAKLSKERPNWLNSHQTNLKVLQTKYSLKFDAPISLSALKGVASGEAAMILRVLVASPERDRFSAFTESFIALAENWIEANQGLQQAIGSWQVTSVVEQRFYAGQMALALLETYEATEQTRSLELANDLINWISREAEPIKPLSLHPAAIPWYAMALHKRAQLRDAQSDWQQLQSLSLSLLAIQDKKNFSGRFWVSKGKDFGPPNTVRDAQSTKTLLLGLEASIALKDQRATKKLRKAIVLGLDNLIAHQYTPGLTETFPNPRDAVGAVRFRYNEALCRVDSTMFAIEVFDLAAKLAQQDVL
jgi:hypothetical protein